MEAIILVGVQGAGKTTFYRERFFETHVRISMDMLKTRERERTLVTACLASKQPFVIDNTNPTAEDRARYVPAARAAGFRIVGYFFDATLKEAISRNNQRTGKSKIPVAAIGGTLKKLQPPTVEEGFDEVHRVRIGEAGGFEVTKMGEGAEPRK